MPLHCTATVGCPGPPDNLQKYSVTTCLSLIAADSGLLQVRVRFSSFEAQYGRLFSSTCIQLLPALLESQKHKPCSKVRVPA